MKRKSDMPTYDRIKAGNILVLLLAACFSLALGSCSSSSAPSSDPDAGVNQNLVYQHLLGKDATLKPHQTAVLNISSLVDDHLSLSPGSGYHNLPYEITNAGKYKYCIPDEDTHLSQVELFDPAGTPVATWKKGEACTAVPLVPGKYTMHVHLDSTESDPPIFLKPHDVKVTQTGTVKRTSKSVASYSGTIPQNQFLNLKVDSLTDILLRNKAQGLQQQGWGVSVRLAIYDWGSSYFESDPYWSIRASQITEQGLFYFKPEQDKVSILQGNNRLSLVYVLDNDDKEKIYMSWESYDNTFSKFTTFFKLSPSGTDFTLYDPNNKKITLMWCDHSTDTYNENIDNDHFKFNVKVRYGTTAGVTYPAMLANEVALFDGTYGPSGFPDNTHYWIINADMKDFNDFAFDNPTNRIRTVIAGRKARAQLFQNPSFQGSSAYVSPPMDGELLMTGTDITLLNNGTIGSIRVEANTNDIPVNEYEFHIIVSANTCIGCDLRGFDLSSIVSKNNNNKPSNYGFNFSDSDLSNAKFSVRGAISFSDFTRTNFNSANLSNDYFDGCTFTGTDFTNAVLQNVKFSAHSNQTIDVNNYVKTSVSNSFYNSCPKFESTDLTTVSNFDWVFYIGSHNLSGNAYNATSWWNNGQPLCRPSLANSKVNSNLFTDKRLWQFVNAPGVDFSNMNLDGAVFTGVNLTGAKFTNASLKGAVFVKTNLTNVDMTGADLTGAHLEGAMLTGVDLHKVKTLSKAYLNGMTLTAPNLSNLGMSGTQLQGGSYTNWDGQTFEKLSPLSANGAYMFNTMLNEANLSGAFFQNVSWFGDRATGENAIMIGTHFEHADLPGLNLMKAHLQGANFTDAVLINANLSTLNSADYSFEGTTFNQANLKGANLSGANLSKAQLYEAYVFAGPGQQTATLEVLDDPAVNPNQYRFFQQAYSATTGPGSTDGIGSCPNGAYSPSGNCGDLGSVYWQSPLMPRDPANCVLRPAQPGETGDDNGMVLQCDSKRHPVN